MNICIKFGYDLFTILMVVIIVLKKEERYMTRKRTTYIVKNCAYCATEFSRPPSLARAIYCGKSCADLAQTTSPRFKFTCEACLKEFTATKDHGADRRFCSRKCFRANAPDLSEKECPQCGDLFQPIRSSHTEDGTSKHCSKECYIESQKNGEERPCVNCGSLFYTTPSHNNVCCSLKCKSEHFIGSLAPGWKGGEFMSEYSGHKFVALKRPDRVGKYVAEHRMVVMQTIGRLLDRDEYVIHINNVPNDNRPENLYVCESNSYFGKIRNGSVPWPKRSNLKEYK
jgi:hypothetical protein